MNTKKPTSIWRLFLPVVGVLMAANVVFLPLGLYMVSCTQPNPPRPEITYGEFPFRIEYEKNGELVIVEDTIICKFDGVNINMGGNGKTLKWKSYFASGRESLRSSYAVLTVDDANQIYFSLGGADYYLGVEGVYFGFNAWQTGGMPSIRHIEPDELFHTYGIKLISYEFSQPIVNTFK